MRLNLFVFLLFVGAAVSSVLGQTYHFASHGGGTKKEEFLDFAVDGDENSYVLLKYEDNVDFGGVAFTNPSKNSVLVRYDQEGNQTLVKNLPAESSGFFFGALGVSDAGVVVAAAPTKSGTLDGHPVYSGNFIGKLGADGAFEWILQPVDRIDNVRQFLEFRVTAIEVTRSAIYVAATANGRITLNGVTDPGFANNDQHAAILIKLDMAGNVAWIRRIPTPEVNNHPTIGGGMDHILPSSDGTHLYVAGKVGDGSYNPYEVAYVAKFRTDGAFVWLRKTSSSGSDSWGIAEASNGDVVTGFGVGGPQVIDFGDGAILEESPTGWLGALARFDKNGNVQALRYVSEALLAENSILTPSNRMRLHHVTLDPSDHVVLIGRTVGNQTLKNDIGLNSTSGLLGTSEDVAVIVCDLDFNPIEAHANTGSNNEAAHKGAVRNGKLYFAGEYESYSHPFLGNFGPQFGEHAFVSAGDQDIFVTSLGLPIFGSPLAIGFRLSAESGAMTLSWPATFSGVVVNASADLSSDGWTVPDLNPSLENDQWTVTIPLEASAAFFRLIQED